MVHLLIKNNQTSLFPMLAKEKPVFEKGKKKSSTPLKTFLPTPFGKGEKKEETNHLIPLHPT